MPTLKQEIQQEYLDNIEAQRRVRGFLEIIVTFCLLLIIFIVGFFMMCVDSFNNWCDRTFDKMEARPLWVLLTVLIAYVICFVIWWA